MNGLVLYRVLTAAVSPLMPLYLKWRRGRGKEDAARAGERLGYASLARPSGALLWLHAASVGEALSALPLIGLLRRDFPAFSLLMTTGTVSSARLMAQRLPPGVMHQFVPVDTSGAVRRFLAHWKPQAAVWLESELWPNLVTQAKAGGCRMALVNARLSARSFTRWKRQAGLMRRMLSCFDFIAAQAEEDAARFRAFGGAAEALGNVKFDAPELPVDAAELARAAAGIGGRPVWLAASTHASEEALVARAHKALAAKFPGLLTIIAPRHPARGEEIAAGLAEFNLARRALGEEIAAGTEIYLADTLGELGLWYRAVPLALIGGSLVPHGGQNPLEAVRLGCAVLCGPQMTNFAAIAEGLKAAGGCVEISDAEQLAEAVARLLDDTPAREAMQERALAWLAAQGGASERMMARLRPLLQGAARC